MNRFGFLVRFLPVLGAIGGSGGGAFGGAFTSGGGEGGADLGFGGGAGGGGGSGAVARIASADKEDQVLSLLLLSIEGAGSASSCCRRSGYEYTP